MGRWKILLAVSHSNSGSGPLYLGFAAFSRKGTILIDEDDEKKDSASHLPSFVRTMRYLSSDVVAR